MKSPYLIFFIGLIILSGCSTTRREQNSELVQNTAIPVGFKSDIRYIGTESNKIKYQFSKALQQIRSSSKSHPLNILALSGGGAGGSFGAGALVGMSRRGNRPQFDIVTGVSAGALIAPFAFLGSTWDAKLEDYFSGKHSDNFLVTRGFDILSQPGIFKDEPLIQFVNDFVTDEMIDEIAEQSAHGRMLLVATTDIDKEETVIWDMGRIATQGGKAAQKLFREVLIASASIPGIFAPIIIPVEVAGDHYDEMHIDASATVPFFVTPALSEVLSLDSRIFKGANIYIIINGQLGTIPRTTKSNTIAILSRSFSAVLNHMARTQTALTSALAQTYGMQLRLTQIPIEYPFLGPLEFHELSSWDLFNYGAKCAQNGQLWYMVSKSTLVQDEKSQLNDFVGHSLPIDQLNVSCPLGDSETQHD